MVKKKKKVKKKVAKKKALGTTLNDLKPSLDDAPPDPFDQEKDDRPVVDIVTMPDLKPAPVLKTPPYVYTHPACQSPAFYLMRAPAIGEDIMRAMIKFNANSHMIADISSPPTCLHCGTTLHQLHHRHVQEA